MGKVINLSNRQEQFDEKPIHRKHGQGSVRRIKSTKRVNRTVKEVACNSLYLDFQYFGTRVRESTGYPDTPRGWQDAQDALDQIQQEIREGRFNFAKRFPFASDKKKKRFSELEGRRFTPVSGMMTFGEYCSDWKEKVWDTFSLSKQQDFESRINHHIMPFFGDLPFDRINKVCMKQFIGLLNSPKNPTGKKLCPQTIHHILGPLKEIYYDAVDENKWELPDPFFRISKSIPKLSKKEVQVFTFDEWITTLEEIFWFYKPASEFSVLTGVRSSELAGLREETDIKRNQVKIQHSIVRKVSKDELKTAESKRDIPMTSRMEEVIEQQREVKKMMGIKSPYLFTTSEGQPFDHKLFRKNAWTTALKRAKRRLEDPGNDGWDPDYEFQYRKPYTTRHTFAAWNLLAGKHPAEVARLMGHSSRQMVYERYGKFVKGLEQDKERIIAYLGLEGSSSSEEEAE